MNPVCYFCGAELIWQNDWNKDYNGVRCLNWERAE